MEEIIKKLIKKKPRTRKELFKFKKQITLQYKISFPSNVFLLKEYHKLLRQKRIKRDPFLEILLRKKPIRSLSGISNVSVLTKPYPCPGKCIFCPLEKGFPKSYVSGEPAAERARALNFDPFLQTKKRIEMLKTQGHPTDKIELRIIGGTWGFYPKKYQTWFIKKCFQAANNKKLKKESLIKAQKRNEKAKHRLVGISIETRVDFIDKKEIKRLRRLGITMVELGVQNVFDKILKINRTGFIRDDIVYATSLLKDAGFKVLYQLMPNLLGSDLKTDERVFTEVFSNPDFRPDWIKIYPCLVHKKSFLYSLWKKGQYQPYKDKDLVALLMKIKTKTPFWIRIARIFRDIPADQIEAGSRISNLREVIKKKMKEKGLLCHCLRCREVRADYNSKEKIYLFREDYWASQGKEIFLSWETKKRNKVYSFLRLRIPSFYFSSRRHFIKILQKAAIIREIQTYGQQIPIKEKGFSPQHRGLAKQLIKEAEKIVKKEFGLKKIAVISGIGVRDYYRKLGYRLRNTYMIKSL